jgi:hypothetical protein
MAISKIKATYSLDVETTRELARVARRWNVSKSEALARVIRKAAREEPDDPLNALDTLQKQLDRHADTLRAWGEESRLERHAGSAKREPRSR